MAAETVSWVVGVVAAETVSWVVGVVVTRMSFAAARDSVMINNTAIAVSCAVCGLLIATRRPDNRLGWLLLAAGVAQNATAAVSPWLVHALEVSALDADTRWLATLYSDAWPWSVSLFISLALLHFPDGRLPGRGWRVSAAVPCVNRIVQVLLFSADPNPLSAVRELGPASHDRAASYLRVPALAGDGALAVASDLVLSGTFLAALVGLVVRYRNGDERTRRQLLWLLLAATLATLSIRWVWSRTVT